MTACDYIVPDFAKVCDGVVPQRRLPLARTPTPIEPFRLPEMPEDVALMIKRDDMTGGLELTGNKVRKLEFILADALGRGTTRIYTAGGTQSNHARATAAACAKLGLPCEVFLRKDPSNYNGNIFLDHLFGATVHEIERPDWLTIAASSPTWLVDRAAQAAQARPGEVIEVVPVGGSSPMGTWGYVEFVRELSGQVDFGSFHRVVCTSGSGGTAAGLGLGLHLYGRGASVPAPRVLTYNICDTPEWFYDKISTLTKAVWSAAPPAESLVEVRDARGSGYAASTVEELQFISRVARESGVVFDTCYTGKCLYGLWQDVRKGAFASERLLFVHTGGAPSVFDKHRRLQELDPSL